MMYFAALNGSHSACLCFEKVNLQLDIYMTVKCEEEGYIFIR